MKKEDEENRNLSVEQTSKKDKENLIGYPPSPPGEDIYDKEKEEKDIDPENISKPKNKIDIDKPGPKNEQDFNTDIMSGSDLDVPGSELDDKMEAIGSEDEENNYYSLGGDAHNDLDESHLD